MTEEMMTEQPPTQEPDWFLDDNTPGQGQRPDWLPTNFKKVSDVAKSYKELEKKLGGFTGAPDSYDFNGLDVDGDQLVVQEISAVAKELNMSQEGLNKFLGRIQAATETENKLYLEEQVKKLGPEGEVQLKQFNRYASEYFKPEEAEVVKQWIKTADDLKTFNKMMSQTTRSAVPTAQSMAMLNPHESVAELRSELVKNKAKYDTDKAYRENFSLRLQQAADRERG